MHFVHSTLIHPSRIIDCIVLASRPPKDVDILLVFNRHLQIGTISKAGAEVSYKETSDIYTECDIAWVELAGSVLCLFTSTNLFFVCESIPPFKHICQINLSSENGIEHFTQHSIDSSQRYLCLSSNSDHITIIDLSDPKNPIVKCKSYAKSQVFDIAPSVESSVFEVIINSTSKSKNPTKLASFDASTLEDQAKPQPLPGGLSFIQSKTPGIPHAIVKSTSIEISNKQIATFQFKLCCSSPIVDGVFLYETANSSIVILSAETNASLSLFSAPIFRHMWELPNEIVLCAADDSSSFIFCVPKFNAERKKSMIFRSLQLFDFKTLSGANTILTYGGSLYAAGDNGIYKLFSSQLKPTSSIQLSSSYDRVFAFDQNAIIVGNSSSTVAVAGEGFVENEETLALLTFKKRRLQVCPKKIYCIGGEAILDASDLSITAASTNGSSILLAYSSNTLSLLSESFVNREDINLDLKQGFYVSAIAISNAVIAVYVYNKSEISPCGHLILMDFSFTRLGGDIQLPSVVDSMEFLGDSEIFLASINGTVLRCPISPSHGIDGKISLCLCGKVPAKMIRVGEKMVFISDSIYIYRRGRIDKIDLSPFVGAASFSGLESDNICILRTDKVDIFSLSDAKREAVHISDIKNSQNCITSADYCFSMQVEADKYSILTFKPQSGISKKFNLSGNINAYCSVAIKGSQFLVIGSSVPSNSIQFLEVNSDGSLVEHFEKSVSSPPRGFATIGRIVVISFDSKLTAAHASMDGLEFYDGEMLTPTPISLMMTSNEYIWCVDDANKVKVLIFYKPAERFELVCEGSFPSNATCLCAIDDVTAAIGSNDGTLCVFRINSGSSIGFIGKDDRDPACFEVLCKISLCCSIFSLAIFDGKIIYLGDAGCVGALLPIGFHDEFTAIRDGEDAIREKLQDLSGLSLLSDESIGGQSRIIDLDVFDYGDKEWPADGHVQMFRGLFLL